MLAPAIETKYSSSASIKGKRNDSSHSSTSKGAREKRKGYGNALERVLKIARVRCDEKLKKSRLRRPRNQNSRR